VLKIRHDDHERADVEDENPEGDSIRGLRQHDLGILGLARGDADQLDTLVGEGHHLQCQQHADDPER
jgi:hypothetical protein